jgi:allantoinase
LWGGLVPGSIAALRDMAAAGVAGFKAFACPSGWEEFPPVDEPALRRGAEIAAALQLPVAVHCELSELGHTIDSEVAAVRFAAGTVTGAGARLHVVHVSSAAGVDEARRWPGVSVETCAHYLAVDPCLGPVAHCSPPIRDADEREQLWSRVIDGSVDTIASDHSPCPPPMKAGRSPWAGIDGVGLAVPILLSSGRLELTAIASLITTAARLLRLPHKGAISVGYDADLALVDPAARWTVGPETLWSRHRLSPYEGMALMGQVVTTLVRGRVTFSKEEGPSAAGGGELIRPL